MSKIGTTDIDKKLQRKTVLFLYPNGDWKNGTDVTSGWIVMVDIPRRICASDHLMRKDRIMCGFLWDECKGLIEGDWLTVDKDFTVTFGVNYTGATFENIIGTILLTNHVYINNIHELKSVGK